MDLRTSSRILERTLSKNKPHEVNLSTFAFLFSELIRYSQNRSEGIQDLEDKLSALGKNVGVRLHQLQVARERNMRRESRLLNALYYVHHTFYRIAFGKTADSLERSNENSEEYMIIDHDPLPTRFISLPKELQQLNCNAFLAGMIEAVLEAIEFPAKVTAHAQPIEEYPLRTVFLVKFASEVISREQRLEKGPSNK